MSEEPSDDVFEVKNIRFVSEKLGATNYAYFCYDTW
jgi:hypothetical protein